MCAVGLSAGNGNSLDVASTFLQISSQTNIENKAKKQLHGRGSFFSS
jgi:hypothetical protein